jgi:hypothetical protein
MSSTLVNGTFLEQFHIHIGTWKTPVRKKYEECVIFNYLAFTRRPSQTIPCKFNKCRMYSTIERT